MDEEEYNWKYMNLRVLKSVQDFIKKENASTTAVYPINVPDDLLYQVLKLQGPDSADKLISHIFKLGLTFWSEKLYNEVFGSEQNLEEFIELVKKRNIKSAA
jgi:hypothetical protein